ncbi:MAG: hypothetical protein M0Q42_12635 [Xanthomonadales bacterium]|nr:hypothetical protein [Xanthomonadales bacterium]
MSRALRHKRWFRTVLLGLLALCMMMQPVLAATGDLHELLDHPEHAALHLDGSGHHDAPQPHDGESAEILHTLLHLAHCCAQVVGFETVIPGAHGTPQNDPHAFDLASAAMHSLRRGAPFRPPIQA